MDRKEIEELIEKSAREARGDQQHRDKVVLTARKVLNALFMTGAAVGMCLYFAWPDNHLVGLGVIGASMLLKVIEFLLRFIF